MRLLVLVFFENNFNKFKEENLKFKKIATLVYPNNLRFTIFFKIYLSHSFLLIFMKNYKNKKN